MDFLMAKQVPSMGQLGQLLPLLIIMFAIMYFLIIRPLLKKKKIQFISWQKAPHPMNQNNKRILGIILASVGGLGGIIFGLTLASASNRLYLLDKQKEEAMTIYGVLTGIGVFIFIIGLIMVLTTRITDETIKTESGKNLKGRSLELDELEKLAGLRDKGVITEEEFYAKKKKILEN